MERSAPIQPVAGPGGGSAVRRGRVVAGVVIMFVLGGVALGVRVATPTDGSVQVLTGGRHREGGVEVGRVSAGELQPGDVVVAIDGDRLDGVPPLRTPSAWQTGETLTYEVRRGGEQVDVEVRLEDASLGAIARHWGTTAFVAGFWLLAGYTFLRRSRDPGPAALFLAATGIGVSSLPFLVGVDVLALSGGPVAWTWAICTVGVYTVGWAAMLVFALRFPASHPIAMRRGPVRWAGAAPFIVLAPFVAVGLVAGGPSFLGWLMIGTTAVAGSTVVMVTGIGLSTYRRSADPEVRQQLRWLLVGAVVSASAVLAGWLVPELISGDSLLPRQAIGVAGLPLVAGLGVSVLWFRLFDVETVVNRSLVYASLTAVAIGVYGLVVWVLGVTVTERGAPLAATAVVAVLVSPLRTRLQRAVNRLMYGDRDDPYRVLTRLGRSLEATLAPDEAVTVAVRTIAHALRLPFVAVDRVGIDRARERVAAHGEPRGAGDPDLVEVPLVHAGRIGGWLAVAPRSPREPLSVTDRSLLEDLARQVAGVVEAARLTADLRRSRERLVTAREEERRRLRRDLHDDLGPALAGLALRLDHARRRVHDDPDTVAASLGTLGAQARGALAGVRELVEGLRPPALDELGLGGALRDHASRLGGRDGSATSIDIEVDGTLDGTLPAAVEVAAFRIAAEAMTNAVRHASARTCRVRVAAGDSLDLEVVDDGCGLPAEPRPGVGLDSMVERAEELGGTVSVAPHHPGTRVAASLPLSPEVRA
ncbi:MAG: histidine kinase [Acidimicrobiia bacterium]